MSEEGTSRPSRPDPDQSSRPSEGGGLGRRSFIRWFGGASIGAAAALSGRFDLLGVGGTRRVRAEAVTPEASGFERWGDMLVIPADAEPVAVQVTPAPTRPPIARRSETAVEYESVEAMVRDTQVTFYQLRTEVPQHPQVRWMDNGHPDYVGAIVSRRETESQEAFREIVLTAYPSVALPYGIVGPPERKDDEPSATWPALERVQLLGRPALATDLPDGIVVQWIEGHTYYLLSAQDRARGITLPDVERALVAVHPQRLIEEG